MYYFVLKATHYFIIKQNEALHYVVYHCHSLYFVVCFNYVNLKVVRRTTIQARYGYPCEILKAWSPLISNALVDVGVSELRNLNFQ